MMGWCRVIVLRGVSAGRSAMLVGVLIVVVRCTVAVHRQRRRRLWGRREGGVEVANHCHIGLDVGRVETPDRMIESRIARWCFEVMTCVDDSSRNELRVGFEDGSAIEGGRRQTMVVDEERVVTDCTVSIRSV